MATACWIINHHFGVSNICRDVYNLKVTITNSQKKSCDCYLKGPTASGGQDVAG